jgi:hypothetical protein
MPSPAPSPKRDDQDGSTKKRKHVEQLEDGVAEGTQHVKKAKKKKKVKADSGETKKSRGRPRDPSLLIPEGTNKPAKVVEEEAPAETAAVVEDPKPTPPLKKRKKSKKHAESREVVEEGEPTPKPKKKSKKRKTADDVAREIAERMLAADEQLEVPGTASTRKTRKSNQQPNDTQVDEDAQHAPAEDYDQPEIPATLPAGNTKKRKRHQRQSEDDEDKAEEPLEDDAMAAGEAAEANVKAGAQHDEDATGSVKKPKRKKSKRKQANSSLANAHPAEIVEDELEGQETPVAPSRRRRSVSAVVIPRSERLGFDQAHAHDEEIEPPAKDLDEAEPQETQKVVPPPTSSRKSNGTASQPKQPDDAAAPRQAQEPEDDQPRIDEFDAADRNEIRSQWMLAYLEGVPENAGKKIKLKRINKVYRRLGADASLSLASRLCLTLEKLQLHYDRKALLRKLELEDDEPESDDEEAAGQEPTPEDYQPESDEEVGGQEATPDEDQPESAEDAEDAAGQEPTPPESESGSEFSVEASEKLSNGEEKPRVLRQRKKLREPGRAPEYAEPYGVDATDQVKGWLADVHDASPAESPNKAKPQTAEIPEDDDGQAAPRDASTGERQFSGYPARVEHPEMAYVPAPVVDGPSSGTFTAAEKLAADAVFGYNLRNGPWGTAANMICSICDWKNAGEFKHMLEAALPNRPPAAVRKFSHRRYTLCKRGPWTPEEDELLRKAYKEFPGQWGRVSEMTDRREDDCRDRWRIIQYGGKRQTGPWSAAEEAKLVRAVDECIKTMKKEAHKNDKIELPPDREGQEALLDWKTVTQKMGGTRPPKRCREKWAQMKRNGGIKAGTTTQDPLPDPATQIDTQSKRQRAVEKKFRLFQPGDHYDVLTEIHTAIPDHIAVFPHETTVWAIVAQKNPGSRFSGPLRRRSYYRCLEHYTGKAVEKATTIAGKAAAMCRSLEKWAEKKGTSVEELVRGYQPGPKEKRKRKRSAQEREAEDEGEGEADASTAPPTKKKKSDKYKSAEMVVDSDAEEENADATMHDAADDGDEEAEQVVDETMDVDEVPASPSPVGKRDVQEADDDAQQDDQDEDADKDQEEDADEDEDEFPSQPIGAAKSPTPQDAKPPTREVLADDLLVSSENEFYDRSPSPGLPRRTNRLLWPVNRGRNSQGHRTGRRQ